MKYSKSLVKEICEKVATGDHTIADICIMVGISEQTYYRWKDEKSEFCESVKKAESQRLEAFKFMAKSGLAKLLDIHEYEEITNEYGVPKGAKGDDASKPVLLYQKRVKKKIMPNPTAVIFALTNMDPDNFKHKQDITSGGEPIGQTIIELPSNGRNDHMLNEENG